jgi:peptide chain release factor 2
MESNDFWDNQAFAQKVIKEVGEIRDWLLPFKDLQSRSQGLLEFYPEVVSARDEGLIKECHLEIKALEKILDELEIKKMLSGPLDGNDCYLSINAGAGGTESCDWASMLSRMYQRYFQKKGWKYEIEDVLDGDVAGLKNITFKVSGRFAYGLLRAELGVHRLVRISPFDSNAKRHTSFASVDVIPVIDDTVDIDILPEEIRIDTYRASGAGGQHVNKTESAVRITHLPTGVVVSCQKERSQLQNKESCFKMLKSKLYEIKRQEQSEELKKIGGEKKDIAWGSQIRSYVFQPYTLVKDTRTKYEVGNVDSVMDGDLDPFIHAYLKEFEDV